MSSVMNIVLCMMGAAGNGCIRFEEPTGTENEGLHTAMGCWDKGWCFFYRYTYLKLLETLSNPFVKRHLHCSKTSYFAFILVGTPHK